MDEQEDIIKKSFAFKQNERWYRPSIYFLIDKSKIVYIGKSLYPDERILSHKITGKIIFDKYTIKEVNMNEIDKIENEYIFKYAPKYNKKLHYNDEYVIAHRMDPKNKVENQTFNIQVTILNNTVYIKRIKGE